MHCDVNREKKNKPCTASLAKIPPETVTNPICDPYPCRTVLTVKNIGKIGSASLRSAASRPAGGTGRHRRVGVQRAPSPPERGFKPHSHFGMGGCDLGKAKHPSGRAALLPLPLRAEPHQKPWDFRARAGPGWYLVRVGVLFPAVSPRCRCCPFVAGGVPSLRVLSLCPRRPRVRAGPGPGAERGPARPPGGATAPALRRRRGRSGRARSRTRSRDGSGPDPGMDPRFLPGFDPGFDPSAALCPAE